ncbi:sigma-70 family RNA polymerase sigma factor [Lachnospiraceae bacterium]|nr:sigma-70 family RNA polymerase sigma factor [Lachnospiraceae bacterium]
MKTFLSPLNATEEKEYLSRLKEGDQEAKKILVERNMRLVAHVTKKYQNAGEDMEDLISIGTIGLIKAVSTFQENHGSKLATYAARCIENELLMYFRSRKKCSREVSLYEPIGTDKEGNQIQLVDLLEVDDKDVVEQMELRRQILMLYKLISYALDERERQILQLRYGLNNRTSVTQREIADRLHISRSYVSRIEKKALGKLRERFEQGETKGVNN